MSDIILNAKKSSKKKALLSALDEIDDGVLPSALIKNSSDEKEKKKKKSNKVEIVDDESTEDKWDSLISSMSNTKVSKKKKKKFKGFDIDDEVVKKKTGKKKKKNGQLTDYESKFKPELSTLHNLQSQQSRFVDSLQKKYDDMDKNKSSARGVSKFTTDLIDTISSARSTSLQITNTIINLKKTIADLSFKEKKEFGDKGSSAEQDTAAFASKYLQEILSTGRNVVMNTPVYSDADTYDTSYDELDDILSSSLGETDRDPAVEKYLEYEGRNISVKVLYHAESGEHEFAAYDPNGIEICDYPLPAPDTKLKINLQTKLAQDDYSRKFEVIVVD